MEVSLDLLRWLQHLSLARLPPSEEILLGIRASLNICATVLKHRVR